jgi:myo-inositol-1(or 4)-monophosphatase
MSKTPSTTNRLALDAAVHAARQAGAALRRGFADPAKEAETKAHRHDPVTIYDRQADRVIADILLAATPDAGLVSEEGTRSDGAGRLCWVVDPLDGTNNFLRGVPDFAVSIALTDPDGPCVACIYDPLRDELYTAIRGAGAERNGVRIRVSGQTTLDGAVLGIGFSTESARRLITLAQLPTFAPRVRSLRIVGSAALDLAYVAAGRFDATWYLSLYDWDVAAGRLLVSEAGGQVTDLSGSPLLCPHDDGVLASNGALHGPLLASLRTAAHP